MQNTTEFGNITDLRNELIENFKQMKLKQMDLKMGKELTNNAGKIINSLKVEQEEQIRLGIKTPIPFLQTTKEEEL